MTTLAHIECTRFRESITDFLEKALTPAMMLQMETHRQACEDCQQFLGEIQSTMQLLRSWGRHESEEAIPPPVLAAFRRHRNSTQAMSRGDSRRYRALLHRLLALAPEERLGEVESQPGCHRTEIGEMVIDEAVKMAVRQPREALNLAELGVEIYKKVARSEPCDEESANDDLARAWAILGNARRICSDFLGASEAFGAAEVARSEGSGDPISEAHLLRLRAPLLADCGRMAEAMADIDRAISLYSDAGDTHQAGRALIAKGTLLGPTADPAEAIELLKSGLSLIDEDIEPRMAVVAKHNLIHCLLERGALTDALAMVAETRALHVAMGNEVDLVRFEWLEGKIKLDMGDVESAERSLLKVKTYFVDRGIAYDAALVSLDLALVYLQQARTAELKALAGEMVAIFQSLGIRRETFAALTFFRKAMEIEQTATMGLLRELSESLERARRREDIRPHLSVVS